ncbi:hypothetical protein STRDD11_01167 [Streptococcus sp. DD11]|nr:hypothetical protein STRDD11_01167 [Streptococcus sp. DD11]
MIDVRADLIKLQHTELKMTAFGRIREMPIWFPLLFSLLAV